LLHHAAQYGEIKTSDCIVKLRNIPGWGNYKKGIFSIEQKQLLWDMRLTACERAKALPKTGNPSSTVYLLIEAMEKQNIKTPR
jgi:hypothetical protein